MQSLTILCNYKHFEWFLQVNVEKKCLSYDVGHELAQPQRCIYLAEVCSVMIFCGAGCEQIIVMGNFTMYISWVSVHKSGIVFVSLIQFVSTFLIRWAEVSPVICRVVGIYTAWQLFNMLRLAIFYDARRPSQPLKNRYSNFLNTANGLVMKEVSACPTCWWLLWNCICSC